MSIFSKFLELHFSGLKSILFYPEYQKMFLSGFFGQKKIWEKGWYSDKNHGLTPLQNVDFFRLRENFTFEVQKTFIFYPEYYKNSFFWLFLLKKTYKKKVDFLTKTMETPLQNADFFYFARVSLFRSKKHSLLSRIAKYVSLLLCLLKKKHIRSRSNFCQKRCTNPFAKCPCFWLC